MTHHRLHLLVCLLALLLPAAKISAAPADCAGGIFGVRAQVVRIVPPGAPVVKHAANQTSIPLKLDDVVCSGETVVVDGDRVRTVELYVNGRRVVVEPNRPYTAPGGVRAVAKEMLTFVSDLIVGTNPLAAPSAIPSPTSTRGGEEEPFRQTNLLRGLPAQRMAREEAALLSWRGGEGPYVCEARNESGTTVSRTQLSDTTSWCKVGLTDARTITLTAKDARGGSVTWTVTPAASNEIPRPAWVGSNTTALSDEERTAWALWLWKEGGPAWRLQALGMFDRLAPGTWLAAYVRDGVLADSKKLTP